MNWDPDSPWQALISQGGTTQSLGKEEEEGGFDPGPRCGRIHEGS